MAATASRSARYSAVTCARVLLPRKFLTGLYEMDQGFTPACLYEARSACTSARLLALLICMGRCEPSASSAWAPKAARDRAAAARRMRDVFMICFPLLRFRVGRPRLGRPGMLSCGDGSTVLDAKQSKK